jgi:hypothetical protein
MSLANSGSPGGIQPDHLTMFPEQMNREQAMADLPLQQFAALHSIRVSAADHRHRVTDG